MTRSLSPVQARKLILLSQRLPAASAKHKNGTLRALEHLGYVQIDTISVLQRAHHHVLWSRYPQHQNDELNTLVAQGHAFEYWSHAAAYLPMRDFRHSLPRKEALASGEMDHWHPREPKQMREVLARIRGEGPLKARDFEQDSSNKKAGEWHHKPAKRALTNLFMQGELMCCRREGFQMVYELRERVLPAGVDTRTPSVEEHAAHLISRYVEANGLAQAKDISYLRKGLKANIRDQIDAMIEARELVEVKAQGQTYLTTETQLALLDKRQQMGRVCILSPFDNLLIQRHRMRELFGFDYQIECYVPAAKRQFGYFSLPLLWRGQLVARLNCKAERKTSDLRLISLHPEHALTEIDAFVDALLPALRAFQAFNVCETMSWQGMNRCLLNSALASRMAAES